MAKEIPSIKYLGACYNVVTMDPLSLADTALPKNVFNLGNVRDDGSFDVPQGVSYRTILKTSYDWQSSVISSVADLQNTLKQSADVSAGMEGAFEFSGSATYKEIQNLTESRKHSFVYARAFVELLSVSVDIADPQSGLRLDDSFQRAVADLPTDQSETSATKYEDFITRFGTHFTWQIIVGGMATQRTSGLASRFLKSEETETELKAKGKLVIDKVEAGASADQAQSSVQKSDSDDDLQREKLSFQGGMGSLTGIDDNWVKSLTGDPIVVSAKLKSITDLMTTEYFPQDNSIELKQILLDLATAKWINENGEPGSLTPPLEFDESLLPMFKLGVTGVFQPPVVVVGPPRKLEYWARGKEPVLESPEPANIFLESLDAARQRRPILAGDTLVFKHGPSGFYFRKDPDVQHPDIFGGWNSGKSGATQFVILHAGDSATSPGRIGEYFTEADLITFTLAPLGSSDKWLSLNPSSLGIEVAGTAYDFKLERWDPNEDNNDE